MGDPILNIFNNDYNTLLSDKVNYNFHTLADAVNRIAPERGGIGEPGVCGYQGIKGDPGDPSPKMYVYDGDYDELDKGSVSAFKDWCSKNNILGGSAVIFSNTGNVCSIGDDYSITKTYLDVDQAVYDIVMLPEYDDSFIFSFGRDKNIYNRRYMTNPEYINGMVLTLVNDEETLKPLRFPGFISLIAGMSGAYDYDWYKNNQSLNGIQFGINNGGALVENDSAFLEYMILEEQHVNDFVVNIDNGNKSSGIRFVNRFNSLNTFLTIGNDSDYYNKVALESSANSILLSDDNSNYMSIGKDSIKSSSDALIFQIGGNYYNFNGNNNCFFSLYFGYLDVNLTYTTPKVIYPTRNSDGSSRNDGVNVDDYGKHSMNIESGYNASIIIKGGSFSKKKDNIYIGSVVISGGNSYYIKYDDPGPASSYNEFITYYKDDKLLANRINVGGAVFIEGGKNGSNESIKTPIVINSCNDLKYDKTGVTYNSININSDGKVDFVSNLEILASSKEGLGGSYIRIYNNNLNENDKNNSLVINATEKVVINENRSSAGDVAFTFKNIMIRKSESASIDDILIDTGSISLLTSGLYIGKFNFYIYKNDNFNNNFLINNLSEEISYFCTLRQFNTVPYTDKQLIFFSSSFHGNTAFKYIADDSGVSSILYNGHFREIRMTRAMFKIDNISNNNKYNNFIFKIDGTEYCLAKTSTTNYLILKER